MASASVQVNVQALVDQKLVDMISQLQDELLATKQAHTLSQRIFEQQAEELTALKQQLDETTNTLKGYKNMHGVAQSCLEDTRAELRKARAESDRKRQDLERKYDNCQESRKKFAAKCQELEQEIEQHKTTNRSLQQYADNLLASREEITASHRKTLEELSALKSNLSKTQGERDGWEDRADYYKSQHKQLEQELGDVKHKLSATEDQLETAQRGLKSKNQCLLNQARTIKWYQQNTNLRPAFKKINEVVLPNFTIRSFNGVVEVVDDAHENSDANCIHRQAATIRDLTNQVHTLNHQIAAPENGYIARINRQASIIKDQRKRCVDYQSQLELAEQVLREEKSEHQSTISMLQTANLKLDELTAQLNERQALTKVHGVPPLKEVAAQYIDWKALEERIMQRCMQDFTQGGPTSGRIDPYPYSSPENPVVTQAERISYLEKEVAELEEQVEGLRKQKNYLVKQRDDIHATASEWASKHKVLETEHNNLRLRINKLTSEAHQQGLRLGAQASCEEYDKGYAKGCEDSGNGTLYHNWKAEQVANKNLDCELVAAKNMEVNLRKELTSAIEQRDSCEENHKRYKLAVYQHFFFLPPNKFRDNIWTITDQGAINQINSILDQYRGS